MKHHSFGILSGLALAVLAGTPAASETVDYVKVCDAYGAGFYYIPGTETCLRIGGSVDYSRIQNPSRIGAGTTVVGGSEDFTFSSPGWINRWGASVNWEYGLGKDPFSTKLIDGYYGYLFGDASFATGRERAVGSSVVGAGGVTQIGLTFGQPHGMYGTGVGSTTAGFGVTGWNTIDSTWGIGTFGAGKMFLDDEEDEPDPFYFGVRIGGFVEHLNYTGQGRADITLNGNPVTGFYQDYRYNSGDTYIGAIIGMDAYFHPTDRWRFTVGAELRPAYRWGHASLDMNTGVGGTNVVTENFNTINNGFTLGATLKAGAEYQFGGGWSGALNYQWSIVPGVTAVDKPAGPAFQPLMFNSRSVQRHEVMFRVQRTF